MKKFIFGFIAVLVLVAGGLAAYKCFSSAKDGDFKSKTNGFNTEHESDSGGLVNVEKYLNEIGEIQKNYSVTSSADILSEETLMAELAERGFVQYPVETNYSLDGEYYVSKEISQDSAEKHPIYETFFLSGDENLWCIEIVNGSIYASSFEYNYREDLEVPVILSETEYIISYDSAENQFFEVIPNSSEMIVKVVPKIDVELLESLTIEGIDEL